MEVLVEKKAGVMTIILNRPEVKNAVNAQTAQQLADAFRDFEADEEAKVAVLWGKGGCFCAGADLKALAGGQGNRFEPHGDSPMGPCRMKLSKPVIAAISGYAVAGGMELALWCDLRVIEENAYFGIFCRRWGVPLVDGGTIRLPRIVGLGRALDLMLTGRPVDAQESLQIGLANRVVGVGEARTSAEELAQEIARFPQLCMRNDRLSALEHYELSEEQAFINEYQKGREVIQSQETQQGAQRFKSGKGRSGDFENI
ncbi:MAG: crotonase/enoyl-CoA hydratase family protein [Bacteroidota bacterium]